VTDVEFINRRSSCTGILGAVDIEILEAISISGTGREGGSILTALQIIAVYIIRCY
jgi:hypothetical protein